MEKLRNFGINPDENTKEEIAVYSLAFCYSRVEKAIEDYLRQHDLSVAKFNTLLIIEHQGGKNGISQVDIGKKLVVTASNMTKLLDRLSKEGLIKRYAQKGDRRVKLIRTTPKATAILNQAWGGYVETVKKITGCLEEKELTQVSTTLIKWFEQLK